MCIRDSPCPRDTVVSSPATPRPVNYRPRSFVHRSRFRWTPGSPLSPSRTPSLALARRRIARNRTQSPAVPSRFTSNRVESRRRRNERTNERATNECEGMKRSRSRLARVARVASRSLARARPRSSPRVRSVVEERKNVTRALPETIKCNPGTARRGCPEKCASMNRFYRKED